MLRDAPVTLVRACARACMCARMREYGETSRNIPQVVLNACSCTVFHAGWVAGYRNATSRHLPLDSRENFVFRDLNLVRAGRPTGPVLASVYFLGSWILD
jgi:hypothetical protein